MKSFIACVATVAMASAAPSHPVVVAPAYAPAPASYHKPAAYEDAPAVYAYEYAVSDSYSGANFGQNEKRDGYATNGEYRVALPDGRTQIVTYQVTDGYSGYIADVRYEGEPHYPEHKESYHAPKPTYHAEPTYHAPKSTYHA